MSRRRQTPLYASKSKPSSVLRKNYGVSEQRAKQKILALQEAQKRAIAAAQETEEKMREVEALLPDLVKKKEKERRECEKLEAEAAKVRKEREQIEEAEKK